MWVYRRLAVWSACWFYHTIASKCAVWYAYAGAECSVYGIWAEVFAFGDPDVRKLLADIQIEEQNHAEMLYKYKTVNSMV